MLSFPADSRVASIIRGPTMTLPRGDDVILPGDRIVVIGSPQAATAWGELLAPWEAEVTDVVIFGAGKVGTAIARQLLEQGIGVRLIEENRERARAVAEALPEARVYNVSGLDPDFLAREQIGHAQAAVFAMREDAKNHYAATLARIHGVTFTIAIVHDADLPAGLRARRHRRAGRSPQVTAEEIVRFAHDPRTQQVAMLENDRFEVLDITTQPDERVRRAPLPGDADPRRPDRRHRPGRPGGLPAQRRHPAGGRPGDRVHRVRAGPGRRARPVTRRSARESTDAAAARPGASAAARGRPRSGARPHRNAAQVPQRRRHSCRRPLRSPTASRRGRSSPRR